MSGGGGDDVVRVPIPENVRKTIQSIREITGRQHSDEDIYSVLKDCSMDPNDTAQKLLYLDTFHEVKKKRDKKKETLAPQGRGTRGRRGNFSSKYAHSDAGGRNAVPRRENGVHVKDGRSTLQKPPSNFVSPVAKASTVASNGPSNLPNGDSSQACDVQLLERDVKVSKDGSTNDMKKLDNASKDVKSPISSTSTASDPVSVSSGQTGALNEFELVQPNVAGQNHILRMNKLDNASKDVKSPISSTSTASDPVSVSSGQTGALNEFELVQPNVAGQNHILRSYEIGIELPKNENEKSGLINVNGEKPKMASVTEEIAKKDSSEPLKPASVSSNDGSLANGSSSYDNAVVPPEDPDIFQNTKSLSETTTVPDGHVIFPDHFKVSEALKSGLTFGSFGDDSSTESSNGTGEPVRVSASSIENEFLTVQVDQPVQSESPQHQPDKVPESVGDLSSNADEKGDQWSAVVNQSKQEVSLLTEANQNRMVHVVPNYGFGIMPTVQGVHPIQYEGHDAQSLDARPSSFASENSMASSSPSPSPTPPVQNNVAASPQLVFRPPYPPNYLPYGYINPYFLPPMHQFLSHNGLPQQPSTGNAYLTSAGVAAAAAGVKYPLAQFKPGTTGGNLTPIGFPPLYGSYGSPPVGFNPGLAVTSGTSSGNEGPTASQLKESQIYTTGPLSEVSAWIPPPGQDISSLQPNSLYHLPSPGQHLPLTPAQSGHAPFPGIYPPMTASSTVNPFIQQSQAVSAAAENALGPSSAHQQHQLAHMNWNPSY